MKLDIYTRVSEVGDREGEGFESPETQEVACRRWIERVEGVEAGELVYEENVSGGLSPGDRELGRLIERVERGESGGIIIPWLDRLTRDVGHGGIILTRITEAGGRLVTADGTFDSKNITPATELLYNTLTSVGQYIRKTNRKARIDGGARAAKRGVYLAPKAGRGYARKDVIEPEYDEDGELKRNGRIVPDRRVRDGFSTCPADAVIEVFRRAAASVTIRALRDYYRNATGDLGISDSGIQQILNPTPHGARPYLGECSVPTDRKGAPNIVSTHDPLITEQQWEEAQAGRGRGKPPGKKTGRWSSQVALAGLVKCESGHNLKTCASGNPANRKPGYSCTHEACTTRAAIDAWTLDQHALSVLILAYHSGDPYVRAVLEGDDRYARALREVEAAKERLEDFRASVSGEDVGGWENWKRDVAARQAAVETAREALRAITKPSGSTAWIADPLGVPMAEQFARYIARVVVSPGRRPVAARARVYFVGSEEPYVLPTGEPTATARAATAYVPTSCTAA